jgi:hypothetical protein
VIHKPGLTLVYAPDAPRFGNLIMSHSEAGAGNDEFGNQYRDGDTAYRDAFIRSSPAGADGHLRSGRQLRQLATPGQRAAQQAAEGSAG